MRQYFCKECGTKVSESSVRAGSGLCKSCAHKKHQYSDDCNCCLCKSKRGELSGKKSARYKHGKTLIKSYCCDCGKLLNKQALLYNVKRCKPCAAKAKALIYCGKNSPAYKNGCSLIDHYCQIPGCKNKISLGTFFKGGTMCRECYRKILAIPENNPMYGVHRYGKDNPNWQGGIQHLPYAPEWDDFLKAEIRTRDNFTCQYCGITNEQHQEFFNCNLHIHHIDYNKQNCNKNNLITLCIRCNPKANYNRTFWQMYFSLLLAGANARD